MYKLFIYQNRTEKFLISIKYILIRLYNNETINLLKKKILKKS